MESCNSRAIDLACEELWKECEINNPMFTQTEMKIITTGSWENIGGKKKIFFFEQKAKKEKYLL